MCVTAGLVVCQRCLVPCPQAPALSAWCQGPPHQSKCKLRLLPKVPLSVPPCTLCSAHPGTVQLMLLTVTAIDAVRFFDCFSERGHRFAPLDEDSLKGENIFKQTPSSIGTCHLGLFRTLPPWTGHSCVRTCLSI